MAAMFTMMNNARLGVGVQGLSQADAALQAALAFARERRQGRTPVEGQATILGHADVRRMLMTMAATVATARAICLDCALSIDMAHRHRRGGLAARAAFLTPIAKAFGTDAGCEVSALAMQVFGGMGYVEETGIAQFYRDVRVTAIYEGTNGIQAMDMVGRKLDGRRRGGAGADRGGRGDRAARRRRPRRPAGRGGAAARRDDRLDGGGRDRTTASPAPSPYLRAFALTLGGHYLLKAAAAEADDGPRARSPPSTSASCCRRSAALCDAACEGAAPLYALDLAS